MRQALAALALTAAVLVAGSEAAFGNHTKYYWAGSWTTHFGTVAWRVMDAQDLQTAKTSSDSTVLFNRLGCSGGATYYRGGYQSGDDKGKIMGCATGDQKHMLGRFVSNLNGISGSVDLRIVATNPPRFSGTFREDRAGGSSGAYSGTWQRHFAGDNATGPGGGATGSGRFEFRITWHIRGATTTPPNCNSTSGIVTGHGNAIVIGGEINANGLTEAETPFLARCRTPVINLRVRSADLSVRDIDAQHSVRTVHAVVEISSSGNHRGSECAVGTQGSLTVIDSDVFLRPQNLYADSFVLGGWNKPCAAHRHSWSQANKGADSPTGPGSHVAVEVICQGPPGTGLSGRNC